MHVVCIYEIMYNNSLKCKIRKKNVVFEFEYELFKCNMNRRHFKPP